MDEHKNSPSKDQLVKEAQQLAEDVYRYVGETAEERRMQWDQKKQMAQERWRQAQQRSREAGKKVDRFAHENVWTSLGIAAAVGAMVGMMMGKNKRRNW